MLETLNDDVIVRMMMFLHFAARDVILQARPSVQASYKTALKRYYPASSVRGAIGFLTCAFQKDTLLLRIWQSSQKANHSVKKSFEYYPVQVYKPNSSTAIIYKLRTLFKGAVIFGRGVHYIEVKAGKQRVPGSRVYYKNNNNNDQILRYDFPTCFNLLDSATDEMIYENLRGFPVQALHLENLELCCNPSGIIRIAKVVYSNETEQCAKNYRLAWEGPTRGPDTMIIIQGKAHLSRR